MRPVDTLVLLPGLDGTGMLFAPLISALPQSVKHVSIAYERGAKLGYELLAKFIVRPKLPLSEPFILVAESFSTPVAILLAADPPQNLRGVVLCAGFASSPLGGWRRRLVLAVGSRIFRLRAPDSVLRWLLIGATAPAALLELLRSAISKNNPDVLDFRLRTVLTGDVRQALRRITLPILYLRANNDRVVPVQCVEEIRKLQPLATITQVDGPHLLLQCHPVMTAKLICEFLQNLAA